MLSAKFFAVCLMGCWFATVKCAVSSPDPFSFQEIYRFKNYPIGGTLPNVDPKLGTCYEQVTTQFVPLLTNILSTIAQIFGETILCVANAAFSKKNGELADQLQKCNIDYQLQSAEAYNTFVQSMSKINSTQNQCDGPSPLAKNAVTRLTINIAQEFINDVADILILYFKSLAVAFYRCENFYELTLEGTALALGAGDRLLALIKSALDTRPYIFLSFFYLPGVDNSACTVASNRSIATAIQLISILTNGIGVIITFLIQGLSARICLVGEGFGEKYDV